MLISHSCQFLNCQQHLPNLIRLGVAFVVLDIDSWIANSRRFENYIASTGLTWFTEIPLTNFLEVCKPDACRFQAHLIEYFLGRYHAKMVSIMEPRSQLDLLLPIRFFGPCCMDRIRNTRPSVNTIEKNIPASSVTTWKSKIRKP
jgi:hypothetical protein